MTLAAGRMIQSLLFGVSPHDPATLTAVAIAVGAGDCWPATCLRDARPQPIPWS